MSDAPPIDATDLTHQIQAVKEGIARAENNIKIFSDEVQKQIVLKATLTAELQRLQLKAENSAGTPQ